MPKSSYVKTEQVNLRIPIGIYEEMFSIMKKEKKWNSPQQFIQNALNEKLDRWHKEHAVG
jgi:hypothetical protein